MEDYSVVESEPEPQDPNFVPVLEPDLDPDLT
jgi:hypothetical protein